MRILKRGLRKREILTMSTVPSTTGPSRAQEQPDLLQGCLEGDRRGAAPHMVAADGEKDHGYDSVAVSKLLLVRRFVLYVYKRRLGSVATLCSSPLLLPVNRAAS